jgi:S1-C subfamily serine protease
MPRICIPRFWCGLRVALPLLVFSVTARTQGHGPTQRSTPEGQSPKEVFRRVSASVFVVESLNAEGEVLASGSGVAVRLPTSGSQRTPDTASPLLVVTNKHVIHGAAAYRIRNGERAWNATLVRLDQERDLCALQPETGWSAKPVPVRNSSSVKVGGRAYAIGAPEGLDLTLSEGLVSGVREIDGVRVIQTSAPISPGSSGGGLFDSEGRLIGVTTFFLKESQNLNFALPGEWISGLGQESAARFPASASGSQLEEAKKLSDKAFAAYLAGRNQEAVDAYQEALRLDSSDHTNWDRLGQAQETLKNDDEALRSYQQSAQLDKNDPLPRRSIVRVYLRLHRYDEAIDPANQVVLLQSDDPTASEELCIACVGAKKYREAVSPFSACEVWTSLQPDNSQAWALLGLAQSRAKRLDDAEASLKLAISLETNRGPEARLLYQLGLVYSKQGNAAKVREVYDALQPLDSELAEKLIGGK